ncbi:hypothetical protein LTR94_032122, partial [Friedmanniomyces endolithicus]
RPAGPDPQRGGEAVAARQRRHLRAGPRADLDLRRGAADQSVRVGRGVAEGADPAGADRAGL